TAEWRGRFVTAVTVAMAGRNNKNRLFLVRSNGEACGLTALADVYGGEWTAMVWYLLGKQAMAGLGIISDAGGGMAYRSFAELKLHSLYAWVMEDNAASIRVLQKAGFREAGRIRRATCSAGHQVDRIYFDLIAEEGQRTQ